MMDTANKQWDALFRGALEKRLPAEIFTKVAIQLRKRSPTAGTKLATVFFERVSKSTSHSDPRIPLYVDALLDSSFIDSSDILTALLVHSKTRLHQTQQDGAALPREGAFYYPPQLESNVILQLTRKFVAGLRPKTPSEARSCFQVLSEWTAAVVAVSTSETMMHAMGAELQQQEQYHFALVREAVGQLLIAVLENIKMTGMLASALGKAIRKSLARNISAFVPAWAQTSPQFATRLETAQKLHHLIDDKADAALQENGLDIAAVQVESVLDLQAIRTRAHLYTFVSALSVGLPLTDEAMILSYLGYIYKGDMQSLTIDLITASFDALSGAQNRRESTYVMFMLRSFLINKVPTIMAILMASTFQGLDMEYCITEGLSHIDMTAFPSFSESFLDSTSPLSDCRQDFLFSCTRHSLLPTTSIERLLGEAPMAVTPTPADKYVKETLVAQCTESLDKAESLIDELENVDGNGGAIVQAITEALRTFCITKETASLKTLCQALIRKRQSMDVMLQFTSPCSILQPLCILLDGWRYEEDQGEYQPVYDEFSTILLLVLAFIHRYSLSIHDIGINSTSFVAQLLVKGHISRQLEELSEEERKNLHGWILGLFSPEGISDEVMSACRPQEFYLLVPTITAQAVQACAYKVLDIQTIKNGLEYLSLPFLLPSLIGGTSWLCEHMWEQTNTDGAIVLQLLQKLVKPPSGSSSSSENAAQVMHTTVMSILHPTINSHLQLVERREPNMHGVVDHLQQAIKPFKDFHVGRILAVRDGNVDSLMSVPGNLEKSIGTIVQGLAIWSMSGMTITQPPPVMYSPRTMQLAARFLTPSVVVQAIVYGVKAQVEAGNAPLALDVATALICAPTPHNSPIPVAWSASAMPSPPQSRSRLNLREALKLAFDDAASLMKKDELAAQALVRLHRRVEALCIGVGMGGDGGLSAAAAVGAAAGVDALGVDTGAAAQLQLEDAMGLDVGSAVDPMAGLLGSDPLQQQGDVFDAAAAAGMAAEAGMDLTGGVLTGAAGDGTAGDLGMEGMDGMELMGDGEDDMFAGLDLTFD